MRLKALMYFCTYTSIGLSLIFEDNRIGRIGDKALLLSQKEILTDFFARSLVTLSLRMVRNWTRNTVQFASAAEIDGTCSSPYSLDGITVLECSLNKKTMFGLAHLLADGMFPLQDVRQCTDTRRTGNDNTLHINNNIMASVPFHLRVMRLQAHVCL